MAYTQFFGEVKNDPTKITWKDIFSEFRQKHDKRDMEYAMLAGTSLDHTNETNMLQKWHKPWIFWRVLLIGLAVVGFSFVITIVFAVFQTGALLDEIMLVIGPMVVPISLMILFWELNIPRNISIYTLLGCFVAGAMISFLATGVLFHIFSFSDRSIDTMLGAPLREEPAKLAASVALLYWISKKKNIKIYGLTGLVIGAAVGTGFSAFETLQYGMNYGLMTVFIRMLYAIVGHTLYSAPYAAAIALHTKNSKLSTESFFNTDFAITFMAAFLEHMFWNSSIPLPYLIRFPIMLVCIWFVTLYITRKCLQQAVVMGTGSSFEHIGLTQFTRDAVTNPFIMQVSGVGMGRVYPVSGQGVKIGRNPSCNFLIHNTPGISREHCMVQFDPGRQEFLVYDLNSMYGTFLNNGAKISPGQPVFLRSGDEFSLAGTVRFRVDL